MYFQFLEKYSSTGFKEINREDQLIKDLELFAESNDQFFFVVDMIQMQIIFTSNRSKKMLGVEPNELTPYQINQAYHYDELEH